MKVTVGRLRHDLIARCLPSPGSRNDPLFGLVIADICTQTDISILKDGFRSFPSGHASCESTLPVPFVTSVLMFGSASVSFAGLGFLSFYLAGKIHLFVRLSTSSLHSLYQVYLSLVGRTRPRIRGLDGSHAPYRRSAHRHHGYDGLQAPLGRRHCLLVFRTRTRLPRIPQYYSPLSSPMSHRPYKPRTLRRRSGTPPSTRWVKTSRVVCACTAGMRAR